ncbi:MAG TPA: M14 family metallopeptidase [Candidatus Xenobia bacterium]|jgi:carboxypeptidase T
MIAATLPRFTDATGQPASVSPRRAAVASQIDRNHDGVLSDDEIRQYMIKQDILHTHGAVNEAAVTKQFKAYLADQRRPETDGYHTYQQMADELQSLATQNPDLCSRVSLGKTHEGRDIWALHVTGPGDASKRPGVVFTGVHHAREWMTIESPLRLAHNLLDNYKTDAHVQKDVNSSDIWIVPCLNADGYEYTRTQDAMWRKNRQPLAGGETGVDINRNYDDGDPAHECLYRPPFDTPGSTDDDYGQTSDDPSSEVYRGPKGKSELETQAALKLELGQPNIVGVIDHHSYGNDILRPWGHTKDEPDRVNEYLDCGNKMTAAMDQPYTLEKSDDMYPTTGDSTDCLHAAGITAYTIEMGDSFQPDASEIPSMTQNVVKADMAFLDWIIQNKTGVTRQPLASIPPFDANSG